MGPEWLGASWAQIGVIVVSTASVFALTIFYVRVVGLRSFSKMSGFDLILTLAVGSIVASVAVSSTVSVADGAVALATLFAAQVIISSLRRSGWFSRVVDNAPILLMAGDRFLVDNLRTARVTEADVKAKLRDANVLDYSTIRAVVFETTGSISVLHGDSALEPGLLDGVTGSDEALGGAGAPTDPSVAP